MIAQLNKIWRARACVQAIARHSRSGLIFGGVSTTPFPPPPPFMAAESIRKTLKIVNFTNTNAILIKLTTDTYLKKVFHFPKCWGVTHRV